MARHNFCNRERDWIRPIEEMVVDTVRFFRNLGHSRDVSIEQAALALGMTQSRAWCFFYQKHAAPTADEYHRVRARFVTHLEFQADEFARRSEALRVRLRQMDLPL